MEQETGTQTKKQRKRKLIIETKHWNDEKRRIVCPVFHRDEVEQINDYDKMTVPDLKDYFLGKSNVIPHIPIPAERKKQKQIIEDQQQKIERLEKELEARQ